MIGAMIPALRSLRLPGIRRDLGTTTISNVLTLFVAGSAGIVIARVLGPAARGEYAAVMAWFGIILVIGQFGQSAAVTYYVARDRAQASDYLATSRTLIIASGTLTLGVGVALAPLLAAGSSTLLSGYRLMFITCLANFVGASYTFSLQATNILRWNLVRLSQPVLFVAGLGLLHTVGELTLLTVLTSLSLTIVIQTGLSYWVCHRVGLGGGRTRRALTGPLTRYGLSHAAAALPSALVARLDLLVLSLVAKPAALGQYAVAISVTSLAVPLVAAIGSVAFPRIASRGQTIESRRLQRWAVAGSAALATCIMLPLAGLAHWVVPAVFGQAYGDAALVVVILAPSGVFLSCGLVCEDLLRGYGRPLTVAWVQLLSATLAVALLAALVLPFGILGAAAATTGASGASLVLLIRALRSSTHGSVDSDGTMPTPATKPPDPPAPPATATQSIPTRDDYPSSWRGRNEIHG